ELLEIWRQENSESNIKKLVNEYYAHSNPDAIADEALPILFINITKKLLQSTAINPRSISLISEKNCKKVTGQDFPQGASACADLPDKHSTNKSLYCIVFNTDFLANASLNEIIATSAHEIGHHLSMHEYTF